MASAPSGALRRILLPVSVIAALAGCSKDTASTSCASGTPANLVGSYDLLSYTIGSNTTPAPPAIGNLRFHAGTYGVDVTLPGPQVISDSGTYALTGSDCISQTSLYGHAPFVGVYALQSGILTIDGTASGTVVSNIWARQ